MEEFKKVEGDVVVNYPDISLDIETYNDLLKKMSVLLWEAHSYAEAHVKASLESGTKEQAEDDKERVNNLYKVIDLIDLSFMKNNITVIV